MHRLRRVLLLSLVVLVCAQPAYAADPDPTPEELARMIVAGTEGEQALAARWLEDATRDELRAVFRAVRARAHPAVAATPPPRLDLPPVDSHRRMIDADIRIIDLLPAEAALLLGRFQPTSQKTWHILTGAEVEDLLRRVEKSDDATLISAPRIYVEEGQKANVSLLDQVSYVKDYEIEISQDGTQIANPVIAVIQDGLVIDFRATADPESTDLHLDFVGTWAALKRPIPELTQEIAGQMLPLQIPELNVTRARAKARVPLDGWALIGGGSLGFDDKKVDRIALVHLSAASAPGEGGEDEASVVGPAVRKKPGIRKK